MTASDTPPSTDRWNALLRRAIAFARHGGRRLARHGAPQLAAALAYRTIFSLIPLLVLMLVILRAIYGAEGVKTALNESFEFLGITQIVAGDAPDEDAAPADEDEAPSETPQSAETDAEPAAEDDAATATTAEEAAGETPAALTYWIRDFIDRATQRVTNLKLGIVTVIGVLVFFYAALSLVIQIEEAFNVVTGAPRGRKWVVRLTNYWTLLTLGSILLASSFVIGEGYEQRLAELPGWLTWAAPPLRVLAQLGSTWLLLLFAYTRMPNARVRVGPAAIGAIVATVLWESGKNGLALFVRSIMEGQIAVYGSLALIPMLLIWIYITWLIVLFGLEVAHTIQTHDPESEAERHQSTPFVDPTTGALLLAEAARAFDRGGAVAVDDLADACGLTEDLTSSMCDALAAGGLLHRLDAEDDAVGRFALARPPERITILDVVHALDALASTPVAESTRQAAARLDAARRGSFAAVTIADLAADAEAETTA